MIAYNTGKVIDIFVSSGICDSCNTWKNKLTSAEFDEWHEQHVEKGECQANHEGPSGNMEVNAIKEMFNRSEASHGVKYETYVGDGDSKTYSGLVKQQPYGPNFEIKKKVFWARGEKIR